MDSQEQEQMTPTHMEHREHEHQKHPSPKQENTHKILIGAAIVQVLLLVFISFQISNLGSVNAGNNGDAGAAPAPSQGAPTPSAPVVDMAKIVDDDAVLGKDDAPVTIVEFSDYQCPYCKRWHTDTFGQIKEKYIDTGKVKFIYRDFPLSFHQNAQKAAEAAECAGEQNKYYEMHAKLFENGNGDGSGLAVADLKRYAQELKLDTAKFNTCLDSGAMRQEVSKDMSDGQRAGIQGTPGFFLNGQEISGAQPFPVFEAGIEAVLSE